MLRRRHFPFTKAVKFGFSVFFIHSAHTYWIQIFGFSHRVGRIVAIEGSNMLILWSLQTFSLYQNQDEESRIKIGKNDVPPSASSQNRTFLFFKYFLKNIPHITVNMWIIDMQNLQHSPSGLNWATMVTVCPAFFRAAAACSCVALDRSTPFTYEYRHTQLAAKDALTRANWKHSQVQVLFW